MSSCGCQKDAETASTEIVIQTMNLLADQIKDTAKAVSRNDIYDMLAALLTAKEKGNSVFVVGAGRSGLVGRAFAMRLMHMGFKAYVISETVTPAVSSGDVLVAISGSGNTKYVVEVAKKCKRVGAAVVAVTSKDRSELKELPALNVVLPAKSKEDESADSEKSDNSGNSASKTPMGTSFEILALVFLDSVIMQLIELTGVTEDEMKARHANTE
ncbi:3-hexulose-6-phosphate isomerase [Methanimicrococcus sp. At1]|uniref:3-hexulose-6-phosphate isomerase n=1 Tax=Methanimicrococcus hacksteinii TaxID=3028293 RepID=A0ABU3VRV9_9EURY|nr:6-phospho-3-hexuloisomerase [Methanimicrococcus sp. At1]MDV0446143.1 3-hexulose-6-phosphate isomerase [Methanimicrococcus sp. At1]